MTASRSTHGSSRRTGLLGKVVLAALLITLSVGAAKTIVYFVQLAPFRYSLDYGEGPLLDQASSLLGGENIYFWNPTDYPHTIANYPPLYVGLLALTSKQVGLSLWAGRAISGMAALLATLCLFLLLIRLTKDWAAGAVGALLFLAFPFVTQWAVLARVDMLALSLCLLAMVIAVSWPTAAWSALLSATVLALAVYTRQSYLLAGPLAVSGWYWMHSTRTVRWFLVSFTAQIIVIYALLQFLTGGGFFVHTIAANVNSYSPIMAVALFLSLALLAPILIALAVQQALPASPDQRAARWFLTLFLLGSALSALTIGKVGANVNYFLELVAALALAAGYAVARWRQGSGGWLRVALVGVLVVQALWLVHQADAARSRMAQQLDQQDQLQQLERLVQSEPREILADSHLEMLVLNDVEVLLQPFEMMQLANQGRWNEAPVLSDIEAQRFGMILVSEEPALVGNSQIRGSWSPRMWQAIQEHYYSEQRLAGMTVYRPKPSLGG